MSKRSLSPGPCTRFLFLSLSMWSVASSAKSAPHIEAGPIPSPALQALQIGDFSGAKRAPVDNPEERLWVNARIHLARFELDQAAETLAKLPKNSAYASELAWLLAHARKDPVAIASSAARHCANGDPTGRSCVDAEFYENRVVSPRLSLRATTRISMAMDAPFPLVQAQIGGKMHGVVVDSGASQSVVSLQSARNLGLAMTEGAFPIAVAGGEGIVPARLAVLPLVDFGPMQIWTVPVLVVDMPALDSAGVGLILSPQQVFDGQKIVFDFPRGELQIGDKLPEAELEDASEQPYFAAGFDLVVQARMADGPTALFGLDTGMEGPFVVSSTYWDRLPSDAAAQRKPTAGAILYGAGGEARVEPVLASKLQIGALQLTPPEPGVRTEMKRHGTFKIAGLLGNGLWRDRQVVLDTRNHLWRMGPAAIP